MKGDFSSAYLLQIFCEFMLHSKVIFISMTDPDDIHQIMKRLNSLSPGSTGVSKPWSPGAQTIGQGKQHYLVDVSLNTVTRWHYHITLLTIDKDQFQSIGGIIWWSVSVLIQYVCENASETPRRLFWSCFPAKFWDKQWLKVLSCRTFQGLCRTLVQQKMW